MTHGLNTGWPNGRVEQSAEGSLLAPSAAPARNQNNSTIYSLRRHPHRATIDNRVLDVPHPATNVATYRRRNADQSRAAVSAMLWTAYPSRSEGALCRAASSDLGCSENTVRRVARAEQDINGRHLLRIMDRLGAERTIEILARYEGT